MAEFYGRSSVVILFGYVFHVWSCPFNRHREKGVQGLWAFHYIVIHNRDGLAFLPAPMLPMGSPAVWCPHCINYGPVPQQGVIIFHMFNDNHITVILEKSFISNDTIHRNTTIPPTRPSILMPSDWAQDHPFVPYPTRYAPIRVVVFRQDLWREGYVLDICPEEWTRDQLERARYLGQMFHVPFYFHSSSIQQIHSQFSRSVLIPDHVFCSNVQSIQFLICLFLCMTLKRRAAT